MAGLTVLTAAATNVLHAVNTFAGRGLGLDEADVPSNATHVA